MSQDVSSLAGGAAFDFSNQTGILVILGAIRASDISLSEKNELKDSVFMYSNGGRDEAVKNLLEKRLAELGVTPDLALLNKKALASDTITGVVAVVPASGFASGRPTPVFVASNPIIATQVKVAAPAAPFGVVKNAPAIEQTPVSAPKVSFQPVKQPAPTPVEKNVPAPVAPRVIVPSIPIAAKQVAEVQKPEPVNIELKPRVNVAPPSTPLVAPVTQTYVPVETANKTAEERLERIRFIKSDVNGKIGNPVNLVDIDNAIGREYMSALLEAMKLMSSAPAADSEKAMSRLENVYKQVIMLLEVAPQAASVSSKENVVPAAKAAPPTIAHADPVQAVVINRSLPISREEESENPSQNFSTSVVDEFASRSKVSEKAPVVHIVEAATASLPKPSLESIGSNVNPVSSVQDLVEESSIISTDRLTTEETSIKEEIEIKPDFISSVGSATPLRSVSELPTAAEVSANEAKGMDPLYTKDVDMGMDQLLSEWTIFKKSGLFGTGPKGREHPLYLKISTMQIPLILSGRFEGATQEIKQSITDYMNGWRYEQGIVYEANETFDAYLRRVIRHILDLQNKKRRS